jgi:hypothetical protein
VFVAHGGRGETTDVERADQVDLDHLAVEVEVVRRRVLAVLADGARGPANAGAVDGAPEWRHGLGRLDSEDDLLSIRDVTVHVGAADLFGDELLRVRR